MRTGGFKFYKALDKCSNFSFSFKQKAPFMKHSIDRKFRSHSKRVSNWISFRHSVKRLHLWDKLLTESLDLNSRKLLFRILNWFQESLSYVLSYYPPKTMLWTVYWTQRLLMTPLRYISLTSCWYRSVISKSGHSCSGFSAEPISDPSSAESPEPEPEPPSVSSSNSGSLTQFPPLFIR